MKAILVIDMPKSCEECDYCGLYQDDVDERACLLMEGHFIGKLTEGERDAGCPLKPLPELMPYEQTDTQTIKAVKVDNGFCLGWNTCLEEITNE